MIEAVITDQASAIFSGKLQPLIIGQDKKPPFATYTIIDNTEIECQAGSGPMEVLAQIDVYSKTYAEAWNLTRQIRAKFKTTKGTIKGIRVNDVKIGRSRDLYEQDPLLYHVSTELLFKINS